MTVKAQDQALLFQALAEPIGLVLRTSDSTRARQRLYVAQRGDAALAGLQIRMAPVSIAVEGGDLIIVRGKTGAGE